MHLKWPNRMNTLLAFKVLCLFHHIFTQAYKHTDRPLLYTQQHTHTARCDHDHYRNGYWIYTYRYSISYMHNRCIAIEWNSKNAETAMHTWLFRFDNNVPPFKLYNRLWSWVCVCVFEHIALENKTIVVNNSFCVRLFRRRRQRRMKNEATKQMWKKWVYQNVHKWKMNCSTFRRFNAMPHSNSVHFFLSNPN